MADIHTLPVQRKLGRRRTNPMPGAPGAKVLSFDSYRVEDETAEEKLARIDQLTRIVTRDLLTLVRNYKEIVKIIDPNFRT